MSALPAAFTAAPYFDKKIQKGAIAAADAAATLLLRMQGNVKTVLKPDGSPCTEADTESNALLLDLIGKLTPDIPILAEENPKEMNDRILGHTDCYWTVDPLDVTGNYIQGGDGFSVNIALLRNHIPVFGVLVFPGKDECYYTDADGSAYVRSAVSTTKLQVKVFDSEFIRLHPRDILSIALRERGNEDALHTKQKSIRTIVTTGQHRACMVARGDALMSSEAAGFRAWDSAPTFAIVRAAGGELRQNDGELLNFRDKLALPEYTVGHATLLDRILPHQLEEERSLPRLDE